MREIKFRAWDKVNREFTDFMININGLFFWNKYTGNWIGLLCKNFNEYSLSQYTEFKDKNGVEIYEGDIVEIEFKYHSVKMELKIGAVFYDDEDAQWQIGRKNDWCSYNKTNFESAKVIGNMYENPEILKGE